MALTLLLAGILPAAAQSVAEQHVELRAVISQWMGTVEKTHELESDWTTRQQELKNSIEGMEVMLQQAEADIAKMEARLALADESSQEKLAQQKEFNEAREALRAGLPAVEAAVAQVVPLLPEFYVSGESGSPKLKAAIESLAEHRTAEPDEKEKLGLNSRIQPLVHILTEGERFHSKLWAVSHPLRVGEVEKQMNVLYFGLAVAYAVDDAAEVALVGRSSDEGWTFAKLSGEGLPERVQALYQAADQSGESQMVTLPLTVD
ncbi:DUF3450 family protein [Roseibacillus ishigakijimensis]|uniref:DUF3450 family protein n=2 Tax=Roseibacillus ishigakijimensis TaxID=454146 RepID=A0A934RTN5_9BACT|nr:DUF3450 family protein [Roseibacillus ishigakijimensis]